MAREISNSDDVIDSRDVIERIKELEADRQEFVDALETAKEEAADAGNDAFDLIPNAEKELKAWDESDAAEELRILKALADEASGYAADWKYGETLIRDSYFQTYAEELADDIGAIDRNAAWPLSHINWERAAAELRQDYTSVDFDGVTYWIR